MFAAIKTSERLTAHAAAYVKKSGLSYATSDLKFKRPATQTLDNTTRLSKYQHVNTSSHRTDHVAESDFFTRAARIYSNSYRGFVLIRRSDPSHDRRTEDSRGGRDVAARSKFSRVREELWNPWNLVINLLVSHPLARTNGDSALCWTDARCHRTEKLVCSVDSICLRQVSQVPVALWGTRFSTIEKLRLLSHHFRNEAWNRWFF